MSTPLDTLASQAVYAARLFERALHSPDDWTVTWGPFCVPAERIIDEDSVVFRAEFPAACYVVPPDPTATLYHEGVVMAVRTLDFVGDTAFEVTWTLVAKAPVHGFV